MVPAGGALLRLGLMAVILSPDPAAADCRSPGPPGVWRKFSGGPGGKLHVERWIGDRFLAMSAHEGDVRDGGIFDPCTESWTSIEEIPRVPGVRLPAPVFTGRELLFFGGWPNRAGDDARTPAAYAWRYDLGGRTWRPMSATNAPAVRPGVGRGDVPAADWGDGPLEPGSLGERWTGSTLLVWDPPLMAAYDPRTDAWRTIPSEGAPTAPAVIGPVHDGSVFFLPWVDSRHKLPPAEQVANGFRLYDARRNLWRATSAADRRAIPPWHLGVWDGVELTVFPRDYAPGTAPVPLAWNAATDRWRALPAWPGADRFAQAGGRFAIGVQGLNHVHDSMSVLVLDRGAGRAHAIPLVDAAQAQWIPAPDAVMFLMGTTDYGGRNLLFRFHIGKNRWERAELPADREIKGHALTWHDGRLWQYLAGDLWVVTPVWRSRAGWK